MSTSTRLPLGAHTRMSLSVMASREEGDRQTVEYAGQRDLAVADELATGQLVGPGTDRDGQAVVVPPVQAGRQPGDHRDDLVSGGVTAGDGVGVVTVAPQGPHRRIRPGEPLRTFP